MARKGSLWTHLSAMSAGIAIPAILLAAIVLYAFAKTQHASLEREIGFRAQSIAAGLDRELQALIATAEVLANSDSIRTGRFELLEQQATALIERIGIDVVVRDREGNQIFNSRLPRDAPLPRVPNFDGDEAVLRTGRTYVTDVFYGAVARTPLFAIDTPIFDQDKTIRGFLNLSLPVERLRDFVLSAGVPPDTIVGVVDRKGVFLTRTTNHETFAGTPGTPELINQFRQTKRGTWRGVGLEGKPIYVSFARLETADWTVATSVPVAVIDAALRRGIVITFVFAGVLGGMSGIMAVWGVRRILAPVDALVADAERVGRGETVSDDPLGVAEFSAIRAALADTSQRIAEARELDGLLRRELAHRVMNTFAIMSGLVQLEARRVSSPEAQTALTETSLRMSAMASLYRRLHQIDQTATDVHDVDGAVLLRELAGEVERTYLTRRVGDTLNVEVSAFVIPAHQATSVAILTNELLTNAIKHGHDGDPAERRRITIRAGREGDIGRIAVSDSGPGFPDGFDPAEASGFGMRAVASLVRGLGGRIAITRTDGRTTFAIEWPIEPCRPCAAQPG